MRMNELTRYFDKYVDFDAIGERIDALQERLSKLREHLPDAPSAKLRDVRKALPSYAQVRSRLPYAPPRRSYTFPATLAVGGIAILGAIVVTAVLMNDAHKKTPKSNADMT